MIDARDEGIGGEMLGGHYAPARRYPSDRVCKHRGCGTVLSVYNSRPMCAMHDFCPDTARLLLPGPNRVRPRGVAHAHHRAA
jgi:hypothetical protein